MIDEVRKCPSLFNKLKIVPDNTDEYGNFYLTGSQKLQLPEDVSEPLTGREWMDFYQSRLGKPFQSVPKNLG